MKIELSSTFLSEQHSIVLSLATLKRRLSEYGLRRRGTSVDNQQLRNLIQQITSGIGFGILKTQLKQNFAVLFEDCTPH